MAPPRPPVQQPPIATLATRAISKKTRRSFTDTLKAKGVRGLGFGLITNSEYDCLLGADAASLRRAWGLSRKANLREHMSELQLAAVAITEAMAANRLAVSSGHGSETCRLVTISCAGRVRRMLNEEPGPDPAAANAANDVGRDEEAA